MMMRKMIICLALIGVSLTALALVSKGFAGNPTAQDLMEYEEYSLRDRGRYLLTENLVMNGSFALTREQADIAAPDVGYYNGRWFELYPPGLSVLAVPFYVIGQKFGLSLMATFAMGGLFALGIIVFIYLISRNILKMPVWASLLSGFIFGLGTTSLGYATSLFQHHATAFLLISSFYAVYKYRNDEKWGALWACYVWLAYAYSIWIDYPNAIVLLPVMAYLLVASVKVERGSDNYRVRLRVGLVVSSVFFIAMSAFHGYYNHVNFGGWSHLSGSLAGYREGLQHSLDEGNAETVQAQIEEAQAKKAPTNFFKDSKIIHGATIMLFSADRGLFVYSPILILAVFGMISVLRRVSLESGVLISIVLTHIFLYFSWGDAEAGWAFGPRYLIPVMAILSVFASYFIATYKRQLISRTVGFALFVLSGAVALLGAVTTNAVPPEVEAVRLNTEYGLQYNYNFLVADRTSSFAYNEFFGDFMSLQEYYVLLLGFVVMVAAVVTLVLPYFEGRKNVH